MKVQNIFKGSQYRKFYNIKKELISPYFPNIPTTKPRSMPF